MRTDQLEMLELKAARQLSNRKYLSIVVLQKSIISPLLFLNHVNNLHHQIEVSSIMMYADGTLIFHMNTRLLWRTAVCLKPLVNRNLIIFFINMQFLKLNFSIWIIFRWRNEKASCASIESSPGPAIETTSGLTAIFLSLAKNLSWRILEGIIWKRAKLISEFNCLILKTAKLC